MRLRVAVYRNNLPPFNLVFNTASVPQPVTTIAEFVDALNSVVPLESWDGTWGLEEYSVSIASREYQDTTYECLHFQLLKDVFREDEEVIVRSLTTDEVRDRRRGGRLQITSDGRQLLDGIAWGRRYTPSAYRPGVIIPPRKKRRLFVDEDKFVNDENLDMQPLEYPAIESRADTTIDDVPNTEENESEDDSDDDDYVDGETDEEEGESDSNHNEDVENPQTANTKNPLKPGRNATTIATFDDADIDDEEGDDIPLDEHEIQSLLSEASRLDGLGEERQQSPKASAMKKRKRDGGDTRRVSFEGFPHEDSSLKSVGNLGSYPVEASTNDNVDNGTSEDDSGSTSDSEDTGSTDDADESSDFSSDSSSDDSDEDSENGSEDATSSSGSGTSSNELDTTRRGRQPHQSNVTMNGTSTKNKPAADNPPGTGSLRTKKNNDRVKRRKRLDHLKSLGILPEDADFEAMNAYEESQQIQQITLADSSRKAENPNDDLEAKRKELLARINDTSGNTNDQLEMATPTTVPSNIETPLSRLTPTPEENMITPQPASGTLPTSNPSKRSRLDVESSRRMLFSSLGLRAPKTKDAEDELREKLSQSARNNDKRVKLSQKEENPAIIGGDQSWKSKLIISAVECVQEGRILTPPPFPFKQQWQRKRSDNETHRHSEGNEIVDDSLNYDDIEDDFVDSREAHSTEISDPQSNHAVAQDADLLSTEDLPFTDDIDSLEDLNKHAIVPGMVIAYKELYMNSKFEPEESDYRCARVINTATDYIEVRLSKRDRREAMSSMRFNRDGDRIYHGLELPEDASEEDNGTRELALVNLIDPKLVQAAKLLVPASIANSQSSSALSNHESAVVPESAPMQSASTSDPSQPKAVSTALTSTDEDELLRPIEYPDSTAESGKPREQAILNNSSFMEQIASDQAMYAKTTKTLPLKSDSGDRSINSSASENYTAPSEQNISHASVNSTNGQGIGRGRRSQSPAADVDNDAFTHFHEEDDASEIPSSLKSLPAIRNERSVDSNVSNSSSFPVALPTSDVTLERGQSQEPSSSGFVDAQSQQDSIMKSDDDSANSNIASAAGDALHIVPATPVKEAAGDDRESTGSSSQTRSSQRLARAKMDTSSPAAKMMKSALAGLGSRKSLNAKRKTKV